MKKALICIILVVSMFAAASCGAVESIESDTETAAGIADTETEQTAEDTAGDEVTVDTMKEFEERVKEEFTSHIDYNAYEECSFNLPENHDGFMFTDMGYTCMLQVDCYDYINAAYNEYNNEAPIEKKTVGDYVFDYQKFDYLGLPNWRMYVIRIAFDQSNNQMEHRFYRFVYNVYGEDYDDAQVEKFMRTIEFLYY
ncbi:MAG: hypothetical protein IJS45_05215 [Clostridia bacterium]|nr:hypothetical protein [Clostridia bacterium]